MSGGTEEGRYRSVLGIPADAPDLLERLVAALGDESWRVRRAASERLMVLGDRAGALRALVDVLGRRGETAARNSAAEALGRMGESAVPPLVALLEHPDPDQRKFAADILGEIRSPGAAEALLEALADPDSNVRVSAAEALGRTGGGLAAHALHQALERGDALLSLAALEALRALHNPPPLPVLARLLGQPKLQRAVYRMLGLVSERGACELLCQALLASNAGVREAALAALGEQRRAAGAGLGELEQILASALRRLPGAAQVVAVGLSADETDARLGALWAAAVLGEPSVAAAVAEAAQDDRLFDAAVETLERLGAKAVRPLAERRSGLSGQARAAAAEALVRVAEPALVPLLAELVASGEPDVRVPALRALGKAQSLDALDPLIQLLADAEHAAAAGRALVQLATSHAREVRQRLDGEVAQRPSPAAVWALAELAGPEALVALRRTVRDPDPRVRAASMEAAGRLASADAGELVRLALTDEAPQVRGAAARALGRRAQPGSAKLLRALLGDSDAGVRAAALEAVGEGHVDELAADVKPFVSDAVGACAAAAVRALGRMGKLDAEVLAQACRHGDPEVVKEALRAGAASADAIPLATLHLKHPRWDVRIAAARTLGSSGGAESAAAVEEALGREENALARDALREAAERLARR